MSSPPFDDGGQAPEALERAGRLRAMGGVLREASGDETDDGWGQSSSNPESGSEAALRREVPPHHGS